MEDVKIEDIGSIKRVEDGLGNPTMLVYESSRFLVDKAADK